MYSDTSVADLLNSGKEPTYETILALRKRVQTLMWIYPPVVPVCSEKNYYLTPEHFVLEYLGPDRRLYKIQFPRAVALLTIRDLEIQANKARAEKLTQYLNDLLLLDNLKKTLEDLANKKDPGV